MCISDAGIGGTSGPASLKNTPAALKARNAPFPLVVTLIIAGTLVWCLLYIVLTGLVEGENMSPHPEHAISRTRTLAAGSGHAGHRLFPGMAGLPRSVGDLGQPDWDYRPVRDVYASRPMPCMRRSLIRSMSAVRRAGSLPAQGPDDSGGQMKKVLALAVILIGGAGGPTTR